MPDGGSKSPISLGGGGGSEASSTAVTPNPLSPQSSQQQKMYRMMVLRDILDSERNHVSELQAVMTSYLNILHKSDMLVFILLCIFIVHHILINYNE